MKLHYTPGSPFSRIIRVLIREMKLDCEEVEIKDFPPPPEYFAVNPLGQVPALETNEGTLFPTRIIIDFLCECAPNWRGGENGKRPLAPAMRTNVSRKNDQILAVILSMADAIAAVKYQEWAGLHPTGESLLGYDPAERHLDRVVRTLDWLELQATPTGFNSHSLSVQDVAFACAVLWSDARGATISWRGRPHLKSIVSLCEFRASFAATRPQPWP
jgi:glutathione S-transferase